MGVSYSSPPRGYLYSRPSTEFPNARVNPSQIADSRSYSSFQEMFMDRFSYSKTMTYITQYEEEREIPTVYTYERYLDLAQLLYANVIHLLPSNPHRVAIYSKPSFNSYLAYDTSLLYGLPLMLSSPTLQSPSEFSRSAKSFAADVVFSDEPSITELRPLLLSVKIISTGSSVRPSVSSLLSGAQIVKLPAVSRDSPCISFASSPSSFLTSFQCVNSLSEWATLLHVNQETRVAINLEFGTNFERLTHFLAVFCRAPICIDLDFEKFNPTHVFIPRNRVISMAEEMKNAAKGTMLSVGYGWKKFFIMWGGSSSLSDRLYFDRIRPKFGKELRCIVTEPILPKSIHDFLTVATGAAICTVLCPNEWGNAGFGLPAEVLYTKYGTFGSPIGGDVTLDQKEGLIIEQRQKVSIKWHGFWDEEGSLVMTDGET